MGAAINALRDIGTVLRNSPGFILTCFLAGVVLTLGILLAFIPLIGQVIYGIVIVPLVLVGLVSVADSALDGQGSFSDFTSGIQDNAWPIISAYGILAVINVAIVMFLFLFGLIVGVGLFSAASAAESGADTGFGAGIGGSLIVLFAVAFLIYAVLSLIQLFLDTAVVISDKGGLEAVKQAWYVLRYGPISCIGYGIVRGVVTFLGALPSITLFFAAFGISLNSVGDPSSAGGIAIVLGLLSVLLLPLPLSASIAYHTGYYRRRLSSLPNSSATTQANRQVADPQQTRT